MVLLLIGALLVCGAAAIGAVAGDGERVTGLWAGAVIGSGGRASVVEVIDYDFGTTQRHGMFRNVPGLSSGAQVAVSSATAPSQMTLEDMGYATRIRIGGGEVLRPWWQEPGSTADQDVTVHHPR